MAPPHPHRNTRRVATRSSRALPRELSAISRFCRLRTHAYRLWVREPENENNGDGCGQTVPRLAQASVDITIPVLNEERAIVSSLTTLANYLDTECPYDWSITVADNGSTDRTSSFAETLRGLTTAPGSSASTSAAVAGQ